MRVLISFMKFLLVLFLLALSPPLGLVVFLYLLWREYTGRERVSTSHGTARLASWADAKGGGLLKSDGLILGRAGLLATGRSGKRLLRLENFTHLATFAATGRGKGVGVVIPNLLTYGGSVVVTDKAGENFRTTAEHRQRAFDQPQHRLDPFHTCGPGGAAFNPLDGIDDESITFLDDCKALANLIVFRQGTEHEPHWNNSAELIITAFIAFVCACSKRREDRNLLLVQRLLSSPQRYADVVKAMQQVNSHHGVIAELGHQISWYVEKELSSVLSTVTRHLSFLSSPAVAASISASSFDPKELRTANGLGVFLCLATDKIEVMAPLLRVWVGSLLHVASKALPSEEHKVLFILDEAAHLGRIDALEQAVTLLRGVGIRLWFFFQSLNQVEKCYGEAAATFLENIDTQQYFGINAFETADTLAKRIGDATITDESESETTSDSDPKAMAFAQPQPGTITRGTSLTRNHIARKVLFPDEILRLPTDVALIFHRNLPVLPAVLPKYYSDPEFAHCLPAARRPVRRPSSRWIWAAAARLNPAKVENPGFLLLSTLSTVGILAFAVASDPSSRERFSREGFGTLFPRTVSIQPAPQPADAEPEPQQRETLAEVSKRLRQVEVRQFAEARSRSQAAVPVMPPIARPAKPEPKPTSAKLVKPADKAPMSSIASGKPACPDPASCPHTGLRGPHICFDSSWCPNVLTCPHLASGSRRR